MDAVRPKMALVWLAHWYTNFEVLTPGLKNFLKLLPILGQWLQCLFQILLGTFDAPDHGKG